MRLFAYAVYYDRHCVWKHPLNNLPELKKHCTNIWHARHTKPLALVFLGIDVAGSFYMELESASVHGQKNSTDRPLTSR